MEAYTPYGTAHSDRPYNSTSSLHSNTSASLTAFFRSCSDPKYRSVVRIDSCPIQVAPAGIHAYGRGRLLFSRFFGQFFRGVLRQTPGKPLATWHQFGTKTRRWSGHFLEWKGSRSNGITMG